MTQQTNLNAPWSLHFDRDGTEDVAIIRDSNGEDLATSRHFWLPEGDDPIPPTLAAMRLMVVAPKLLMAAKATLTALALILEMDDPASYTPADLQIDLLEMLKAAIAEAEDAKTKGTTSQSESTGTTARQAEFWRADRDHYSVDPVIREEATNRLGYPVDESRANRWVIVREIQDDENPYELPSPLLIGEFEDRKIAEVICDLIRSTARPI